MSECKCNCGIEALPPTAKQEIEVVESPYKPGWVVRRGTHPEHYEFYHPGFYSKPWHDTTCTIAEHDVAEAVAAALRARQGDQVEKHTDRVVLAAERVANAVPDEITSLREWARYSGWEHVKAAVLREIAVVLNDERETKENTCTSGLSPTPNSPAPSPLSLADSSAPPTATGYAPANATDPPPPATGSREALKYGAKLHSNSPYGLWWISHGNLSLLNNGAGWGIGTMSVVGFNSAEAALAALASAPPPPTGDTECGGTSERLSPGSSPEPSVSSASGSSTSPASSSRPPSDPAPVAGSDEDREAAENVAVLVSYAYTEYAAKDIAKALRAARARGEKAAMEKVRGVLRDHLCGAAHPCKVGACKIMYRIARDLNIDLDGGAGGKA